MADNESSPKLNPKEEAKIARDLRIARENKRQENYGYKDDFTKYFNSEYYKRMGSIGRRQKSGLEDRLDNKDYMESAAQGIMNSKKSPINSNSAVKSTNGASKVAGGTTKAAGKAMPKGFNMIQDAKDVSRGLEGIGSAMSGDYKKMDSGLKKQADMDTAQGIKAAAGYTGIGKPIVAALDTAEQIPIAGNAVKKAEQKIGKKVNKTMGKVSKIPVVGKKVGNTVKDIGGLGSQVLNGDKAAYNKKQEAEIKSLPNSVNNDVSTKQKLESKADQMAAKTALNIAKKSIPALNVASKIPGVDGLMDDVAAKALSATKDKIKKRFKMQVLGFIGGILGNPITWIIVLCMLVLILILSFGKALVGGEDPQATKDFCKSDPVQAAELKINCNEE